VSSIDDAWQQYEGSPYIINPVLHVQIGRDVNDNNYWYMNITGMDDAVYNSGNLDWYIRFRYYPNNNYLNYRMEVYSKNGELTFYDTDSQYAYGDGYRSGSNYNNPTTFDLYEERYTQGYYELERSKIYATAGSTSERISFRFTAPYDMSVPESFTLTVPSLADLLPQNTPDDVTCIIQPTLSKKTKFGLGLHSPCTYTAATGVFTLSVPHGGLTTGTEYTVSIIEREQRTSRFVMPTTPKRLEVALVYSSTSLLQYGDTFRLDYPGQLNAFSVSHLTYRKSNYDMLGFTFTPSFTLPAASTATPVSESILQVEFDSRFYEECLGVDSLYSADQMTFESGAYFSHYSTPV